MENKKSAGLTQCFFMVPGTRLELTQANAH